MRHASRFFFSSFNRITLAKYSLVTSDEFEKIKNQCFYERARQGTFLPFDSVPGGGNGRISRPRRANAPPERPHSRTFRPRRCEERSRTAQRVCAEARGRRCSPQTRRARRPAKRPPQATSRVTRLGDPPYSSQCAYARHTRYAQRTRFMNTFRHTEMNLFPFLFLLRFVYNLTIAHKTHHVKITCADVSATGCNVRARAHARAYVVSAYAACFMRAGCFITLVILQMY